MENLFIIPTLISPECPYKLIPAICKLVERNTVLSYSSVLRSAAITRYLGPYRGLLNDSIENRMKELISLLEGRPNTPANAPPPGPVTQRTRVNPPEEAQPGRTGGGSIEADRWEARPQVTRRDETEVARGISFFGTISVEPTYLEIPLVGRTTATSTDITTRVVKIGMKCIPYRLDGVSDIMSAMQQARNRTYAKTWFLQKFPNMWNKTKFSANDFLSKSPVYKDLTSSKKVAEMMTRKIAQWTFLSVLTANDFRGRDLKDSLESYGELVKGGWGDMVVIDDTKDIISFCSVASRGCSQLSLDYLKEIFRLDNVIDVDLFKKSGGGTSLFRNKVPFSKVFESSCYPCNYSELE